MLRTSFSAVLILTLSMACVGRADALQDDINTFGLYHGDSIIGGYTPDDASISGRTPVNMTISGGAAPVTINGDGVYAGCLDFGTNGRQMGTFGASWPGGATPAVNAAGSEIILDGWYYIPNIAALPIPTTAGGSGAATVYVFQISNSSASGTKCYLAINPYASTGPRLGEARLQFQKNGGTAVNLYVNLYNYVLSVGSTPPPGYVAGQPYPAGDPNARDLTGRWLHIVAMSRYTDPEPAWDPNYNIVTLTVTDPSTGTTYTEQGNSTAVMGGTNSTLYLGMVSGKASSTPYRGYRGKIDDLKISTRAHAPMVAYGPTPKNAGTVSPSANLSLTWYKAAPYNPVDTITQDVWVGTNGTFDPNNGWTKVAADTTATTASMGPVAMFDRRYWLVDSKDSGTGATTRSTIWTFDVNDIAPIVNIGSDQATYLVADSRTFTLTPTVTDPDNDVATLTYQWTQLGAAPAATISAPTSKNTDITVSGVGSYFFQLDAFDGIRHGTDVIRIQVFATACAAAQANPLFVFQSSDFNRDCKVAFLDFASFASNWQKCNSMDPACN